MDAQDSNQADRSRRRSVKEESSSVEDRFVSETVPDQAVSSTTSAPDSYKTDSSRRMTVKVESLNPQDGAVFDPCPITLYRLPPFL